MLKSQAEGAGVLYVQAVKELFEITPGQSEAAEEGVLNRVLVVGELLRTRPHLTGNWQACCVIERLLLQLWRRKLNADDASAPSL